MTITRNRALLALIAASALATVVYASSGDRSPTFQQCLVGCRVTYCDPSQPPIAAYLRAFGWTCEDDCRYQCAHSFTDHVRTGSRYHQCESPSHVQGYTADKIFSINNVFTYPSCPFCVPTCLPTVYGKWAFYRLGPIQEPFSVLMSIGNLWAHWVGFQEARRRVGRNNKLRKWLFALSFIQMNTWIWSAVFHTRGQSTHLCLVHALTC
jgi:hypothetical protein